MLACVALHVQPVTCYTWVNAALSLFGNRTLTNLSVAVSMHWPCCCPEGSSQKKKKIAFGMIAESIALGCCLGMLPL